jgi:hypothetical protein
METTNNANSGNNKLQMPATLKVIEDAQGEWLEVPFHMLGALDIHDKISNHSKRDKDKVYLRGIRDTKVFIEAIVAFCQRNPDYKLFSLTGDHRGKYSPISDLPDYFV